MTDIEGFEAQSLLAISVSGIRRVDASLRLNFRFFLSDLLPKRTPGVEVLVNTEVLTRATTSKFYSAAKRQ